MCTFELTVNYQLNAPSEVPVCREFDEPLHKISLSSYIELCDVSTSAANSTINFAAENRVFSTKCPICYVTHCDVIVRMSSKDSCVQFGTCFATSKLTEETRE